MESASFDSALLEDFQLGESTQQVLLDDLDLGLLSPGAFKNFPTSKDEFDEALEDGNDFVFAESMDALIKEVSDRQKREKINIISDITIRKGVPEPDGLAAPSMLKKVLMLPTPVARSRNLFYKKPEETELDQPENSYLTPIVTVIPGPGELSPKPVRKRKVRDTTPKTPVEEVVAKGSAETPVECERPVSPVIKRFKRPAAKKVSGGPTKTVRSSQPDWNAADLSATQRDDFSRAYASRGVVLKLLKDEESALERHESRVLDAKRDVEASKKLIDKYKRTLGFLGKTFEYRV